MGGNITVQTEKGKGTEFTVTVGFPLAEPKEETCSSECDSDGYTDAGHGRIYGNAGNP